MKKTYKCLCSLLLALVLLVGFLPAGPIQAKAATNEFSAEDYAAVDQVFDRIDQVLEAPAKKNATDAQKIEAAIEVVKASKNYVEGSLERNGNVFTWWTEEGISCMYNPRMQEIQKNQTPETRVDEIVNEPAAVRGGSPTGKEVYVIGPYYGSDDSFTNQYMMEARHVAKAIGDTDGYTLYSGAAATIDKVAEAVSNGAVVFFDSHGTTDYENGYDCITGAKHSYLCLSTSAGITPADYNTGAYYAGGHAYVTGAAIANHMTQNSPGGIVWMAICLGMGTDTICEPLREKGVEVVYGYSESVTFAGDYLYEETFWNEMLQGKTVAQSISAMENAWGNWDWSNKIADYYNYSDGYNTIEEAREEFAAFPVVVSDEDTHPGKRTATGGNTNGFYGADSLQNVQSTYKFSQVYEVTDPTDPGEILREAYALKPGEDLPYEATLTGKITQVTTAYSAQYNNVTVIMEVPGYETMPIKCYRLSGSGADQIGVGDTITVKGTITNYTHSSGDGEIEFKQGCQLTSWTTGGAVNPDDGDIEIDIPLNPKPPVTAEGGSADFNTLGAANTSYGSHTTADGWIITNAAIQTGGSTNSNPQFVVVGNDSSDKAVCLNGKVSAPGTITSPILTGGLSELTIQYAGVFNDNVLSACVTITDITTNATYLCDIGSQYITQYARYEDVLSLPTPITGNFKIEIVNNCPSGSTSNKDRMTILSITWKGAAEEETPDPIGFVSASLELDSAMNIIFNANQDVVDQYENVYVLFSVPGQEEPVKVTKRFVDAEYNTYGFAYEGLTIMDTRLQVTATIYGTYNGVEYSGESKTTSLVAYCNWALAFSPDKETKNVCANLLAYAMAAEAYVEATESKTDESGFLVNNLDANQKSLIEQYKTADDDSTAVKTSSVALGERITYKYQQLDMVQRIGLMYVFVVDPTLQEGQLTMQVTYKDSDGNDAVKDYTMDDLIPTEEENEYVLKFSEFDTTQMKEQAKLTFYIDGEEHCWWVNSIDSYCAVVRDYDASAEMKYLAMRIALYGNSCYETYGK